MMAKRICSIGMEKTRRRRPRFAYCTHVRMTWFNLGSSVRADVRTIFIREGISTASGAVSGDQLTSSNCYASSVGTLDVTAVPNLRSVHVSKILRFLPR